MLTVLISDLFCCFTVKGQDDARIQKRLCTTQGKNQDTVIAILTIDFAKLRMYSACLAESC